MRALFVLVVFVVVALVARGAEAAIPLPSMGIAPGDGSGGGLGALLVGLPDVGTAGVLAIVAMLLRDTARALNGAASEIAELRASTSAAVERLDASAGRLEGLARQVAT